MYSYALYINLSLSQLKYQTKEKKNKVKYTLQQQKKNHTTRIFNRVYGTYQPQKLVVTLDTQYVDIKRQLYYRNCHEEPNKLI